jgi:hypothetical protein
MPEIPVGPEAGLFRRLVEGLLRVPKQLGGIERVGEASVERTAAEKLTPRSIEETYGIPEANQRKFQRFADARDITIDVRPTNPESVPWLERGALPKPMAIKAKTINDLDIRLGASAEHRGLAGLFEPKLPERGGMPEGEWNALQKRFRQRANEYDELRPKMDAYQEQGKFEVRNGVVYGKDANGEFRPITGDHDIFDIRHPAGSRLSPSEENALITEMRQHNMGVQHGPHMYWQPNGEFEQNIYDTIVRSHQPGGEPLVRFAPGQPPRLVNSGTPAGGGGE